MVLGEWSHNPCRALTWHTNVRANWESSHIIDSVTGCSGEMSFSSWSRYGELSPSTYSLQERMPSFQPIAAGTQILLLRPCMPCLSLEGIILRTCSRLSPWSCDAWKNLFRASHRCPRSSCVAEPIVVLLSTQEPGGTSHPLSIHLGHPSGIRYQGIRESYFTWGGLKPEGTQGTKHQKVPKTQSTRRHPEQVIHIHKDKIKVRVHAVI